MAKKTILFAQARPELFSFSQGEQFKVIRMGANIELTQRLPDGETRDITLQSVQCMPISEATKTRCIEKGFFPAFAANENQSFAPDEVVMVVKDKATGRYLLIKTDGGVEVDVK